VDVAPPWGEPRIFGVSWFSRCNVISIMFFLGIILDCVLDMYVLLKLFSYVQMLDLINSAKC
jgi:hypothetical protein